MSPHTRWGILGSGFISHDFTAAIMMMPATEHQVCAVAARSLDSAKAFNEQFGNVIPKAYGSYEEMAKDPDLDIIYIATITTNHYAPAMLMMEAGKNVLIEKVMSVNSRLVKELLDKAKEKGVFLVEGYWSRFFPIYQHLRDEVAAKTIGDIHTLVVNFGYDLTGKGRRQGLEFGDGALFALGCYPIQLATLLFNERPEKICATGELGPEGYDLTSTAVLSYSGGRRAILNYTMNKCYDEMATMMGTKGIMKLPMFFAAEELVTPSQTYSCPIPQGERKMNLPNSEGFTYEIAAVRNCLLAGRKECPLMSHEHSAIITDTMDKIRAQIGLVYHQDKL